MQFDFKKYFFWLTLVFLTLCYISYRGNLYRAEKEISLLMAPGTSGEVAVNKESTGNPNGRVKAAAAIDNASDSSVDSSSKKTLAVVSDSRFPYRISNTARKPAELWNDDHTILLENAFWDTGDKTDLAIPSHLKSDGASGAYIVQAKGPAGPMFHRIIAAVGARKISYIPNNAFLVQLDFQAAENLKKSSLIQAVLPFEPYYKFGPSLIGPAVRDELIPEGRLIDLILFPDREIAARKQIEQIGGEIRLQEQTPFGTKWVILPRPDTLVEMAQMDFVQRLEIHSEKTAATDLGRERVAVSVDTVTPGNYLDLTGTNLTVSVNDTGIDAEHPDLADRVVAGLAGTDSDPIGHGTHVAGVIGGTGLSSDQATNLTGSDPNADFRGMAPNVDFYILPIDLETGPAQGDQFLNEKIALYNTENLGRTNAIVSNNSWGYRGVNVYNTSAATYDQAVRDALKTHPGQQPIMYVFAAGNSGFGNDSGAGGEPNSISSPGTAKNVITVGALENFRNITNSIFAGETDSDSQIAGFSSRGNVGIGIEGEFGRFKPDVVAPGTWVVSTLSGDSSFEPDEPVEDLGDLYRYNSGTSFSTPMVSGVLALMQEFFEEHLELGYSPALFKAMLINGARSVSSQYDVSPRTTINFQGWGLVNLTNSIPEALSTEPDSDKWPLQFFDQNPERSLTTGESHSWSLDVQPLTRQFPLRISLVWTDPPGNPASASKLVNDLNLVVSNTVSGVVYYGNNIPAGQDFNTPVEPLTAPVLDRNNNVENVFIPNPLLSTNYVITVVGQNVNVNAVTAHENGIAQDYALVISTENSLIESPFALTRLDDPDPFRIPITILTNGLPVLEQSVGANSPLINSPIGDTNQWRFYQFNNSLEGGMGDNTPTPGTNVAFVVFIPPNKSKARNLDADLDLYVSTDPSLTNLNVGALDDAFKSIGPGGTETIFFTNAVIGDIFYIGVKSEDQQAAQFGLIAFSSNVPFDEVDDFGNRIVNGFPPGVLITDGSAELPSAAYMFAIPTVPTIIEEVSVNMTLNHDSIGDLLGNLSHDQDFVVLNNHTLNNGSSATFHQFSYNDGNSGSSFSSTPTDGPGSLNNFIGTSSGGAWILTMVDNALNHIGEINELTVTIRGIPFDDDLNRPFSVLPNRWFFRVVNVPEGVVRLDVTLSQISDSLNLYLRKDITPTTTDFDKQALIDPPGGILSLGVNDIPPLQQARYFIGVFNPNPTAVNFHLNTDLIFGLLDDNRELVSSGEEVSEIIDDAANRYVIPVDRDRQITDVKIGLRVDHPRLSDLDVRLTSPQGTEVLLIESRGGTNVTALGSGLIEDGFIFTSFTVDTNLTTEVIKFAEGPFTSTATFISISNSDFENEEPGVRLFPASVDGWRVTTNSITVIEDATAHQGTKFIDLEIGEISRTFSTPDGGEFLLQFAYRKAPENENRIINGQVILNNTIHSFITASTEWVVHEVRFTADSDDTVINLAPVLRQPGLLIDTITLSEPGGNAFYIPEENLEAFDGESAIGDWILELEDRRVGFNLLDDSTSVANLLSWNLDLTFAPILRTAIKLTNGVPYEGSVERNEIEYFLVDVPRSATIATNFLTGQGLFLTGDQDGVPVGNPSDDYWTPLPSGIDEDLNLVWRLILDESQPPIPLLLPGQRYYLGVLNNLTDDPTVTNTFTIQVDFDQVDDFELDLPELLTGIPITNAIPATPLFDYYKYFVSSNAISASFELRPANGNVNLVIRKGLPIADALPTTDIFDYRSILTGTLEDIIVVSTNDPAPLEPGLWYLGVFNVEPENSRTVAYTLVVNEELGDPIPGLGPEIFVPVVNEDGSVTLSWVSIPGRSYRIEISTDLENWTLVHTSIAEGVFSTYEDTETTDASIRFYRIFLELTGN